MHCTVLIVLGCCAFVACGMCQGYQTITLFVARSIVFFVNRHHCTQLESHPICPSQRQGTSSVGETPSWTANAHTSKINCTVRRLQLHLLAYESCKSNGVTIVGRPRFFCFQCWITNCMLPQSVEYILKSRQHSFASCRTPFFTHTLRPLRAERIPHSLKLDWKWRRPQLDALESITNIFCALVRTYQQDRNRLASKRDPFPTATARAVCA